MALAFLLPSASTLFAQAPAFTQVWVFGDSLSDDGNIKHKSNSKFGISYPSGGFNYADGRFTNSSSTDPGSGMFVGVWHEQLARTFLGLSAASNSLDGGADYAFGGATTNDGTSDRTIISNPTPFGGGSLQLTIDNIGKQVNDFIVTHAVVDPAALYAVWGGGNDLFDDSSAANVTATAGRVSGLVERLANAGARKFLVPNLPPLGAIPLYFNDATKSIALDIASASFRTQLNDDLDASVSKLAGQGITVQLFRVDVWSLFIRMTAEPAKYGFTNIRDGAQGNSSANVNQFTFWDDIHPTTAGHNQIAVESNRVLTGAVVATGKALNVSTRVAVGTGENVSIAGFIITGSAPKKVIVRGIGPSLTASGVPGALTDPTLTLNDSAGILVAMNDNWKETQQTEIQATTLAPTNDLESAIVRTLAPGNYTAILSGKNGGTGIGLVEVYDLESTGSSTLGNISTRGFVGTGDNAMIGGFIVGSGDGPIVVVRAIGPSLSNAGITGALQDPTIELHDGNGAAAGFNDNWQDAQSSAIKATGLQPSDTRESALVALLSPGNYTAVVRGKNNTTGVALVEAYRIQ